MLFAYDGNVKKAFIDSIINSIKERKANICETWDYDKVMSLPWGVKESVDAQHAETVSKYISNIEGTNITLESGEVAKLLKAGLKERKGKYMLIYRYQLV